MGKVQIANLADATFWSRGAFTGVRLMAPLDELTTRTADAEAKAGPCTGPKPDPAETELATLLDAHRHDEATHQELVDLDCLPTSIADRLLRLIRLPSLREELMRKHRFSADIDPIAIKASRHRPQWW